MVDGILQQAHNLQRNLNPVTRHTESEISSVRWVILSGTSYEKSIENFASRISRTLARQKIKLDIVKSLFHR